MYSQHFQNYKTDVSINLQSVVHTEIDRMAECEAMEDEIDSEETSVVWERGGGRKKVQKKINLFDYS